MHIMQAKARELHVQTAVAAAAGKGVLFVSSAGNDHSDNNITPHWPSNIGTDTTISVAALGRNGAIWCATGCSDSFACALSEHKERRLILMPCCIECSSRFEDYTSAVT